MAKYIPLTQNDKIEDSYKVTAGFFTGGNGTEAGSSLATASLSTEQGQYYYNMQKSSTDQFSVTYGHKAGSGSNDTVGQTKAIYKQFATLLLDYDEVSKDTGFIVNVGGTPQSQSDMYFLIAERARMKDRINRKNWTLELSGSGIAGGAAAAPKKIHLTDNSVNTQSFEPSIVGPKWEVVSGTLGNTVGYTHYGYFYPDVGVIALSATQLSASLGGTTGYLQSGSPHLHAEDAKGGLGAGFAPDIRTTGTANNAGKFANVILKGGNLTFRSEEDQVKTSFFCRAPARDFNFSNNPTFASGSDNEFTIPSFEGNPQTFITTVGLYNPAQELIAVGRLSTPVQKNYHTETTIKVDITY